jgi:hypothetical protein
MSFYLTLPSNSSEKYYPDNTVAQFTTKLQTARELTGSWEVALAEISFTKTWHTVPINSGTFIYSCEPGTHTTLAPWFREDLIATDFRFEIKIPFGYYDTISALTDAMNAAVLDMSTHQNFPVINKHNSPDNEVTFVKLERDKWPTFRFSSVKKTFGVTLQPGTFVQFDDVMSTVLGVRNNRLTNSSTSVMPIYGSGMSDLSGGIQDLYIYMDVVEQVSVGDTEAPLLRIVNANGRSGEYMHRIYDRPRYIPVQKHRFDSIECNIRDRFGRLVAFEGGQVTVILHFRQAINPYFST